MNEVTNMQFGAVLPHNEIPADPAAIRAYLEGLERLGVTHLLAYDHVLGADRDREGGFTGPYDKDVAFHEPLTFFAYAAAVTSRLEFMSAVLILPQRQTVLVAKQAAEVAILSGNRLRLGIGTGWNRVEYEALNEDFGNRGKREADQVRLLQQLWSESSVSYESAYHRVDKAGINPRPSAPVPVWFGGSAPAVLQRCAELGDGWVPLGAPNDDSRAALEAIRAHREQAGKPMTGFGVQAQAQYAGGTPERWRSHARRWEDIGATHLAIATHNAGPADVDGHLNRIGEYLAAVVG
jgi:probable F420-dependent oxidoreductase